MDDVKRMHEHIAFRTTEEREAYLPGTGLAVWEVAWIAHEYDGDIEETAEHLGIDCALVREALDYAAEHHIEIEMQIHNHVMWTKDEVLRLLPQARVFTFDRTDPEPTAP